MTASSVETPQSPTPSAAPARPDRPPHPDPLIQRPLHPPGVGGGHPRFFALLVVLLMLSPLLLGFNFGNFAPRLPSLDWTLTIDQRVRQFADSIHQPKIIFVGGSNLRFGLNDKSLAADLGMPVVNYGLHAGLGVDVICDRAAQVIKPGDIVIYAPELSHFRPAANADFSDDLRIDFLVAHPSSVDQHLQSFPTREWLRARSRCNRVRLKLEKIATTAFSVLHRKAADVAADASNGTNGISPYDVEALDADGDIAIPRPVPAPYNRWQNSEPPRGLADLDLTDSRGVQGFDILKKKCGEVKATLCVMPPMRVRVPTLDQPTLLKMESAFQDWAVAHGAIAVMNPGPNVLDIQYGYDTDYHLNDVGVKLMQPVLVNALRPIVAREKSHS